MSAVTHSFTPGRELVYWFVERQLPGDRVLAQLGWKEAVRLAASSPLLWGHVKRMVALARPNMEAALAMDTPDRLRVPLLTGMAGKGARAGDNYVLRWACGANHLEVARWLTDRYRLTAADVRASDNEALRHTCAKGHLEAAQWLVGRFDLTVDDARARNNAAFRRAYANGHNHVVAWLGSKFGIASTEL